MNHFSDRDIEAARSIMPDALMCEVIRGGEALLIAIPNTTENREREVTLAPGQTVLGEQLDGATFIRDPRGNHGSTGDSARA